MDLSVFIFVVLTLSHPPRVRVTRSTREKRQVPAGHPSVSSRDPIPVAFRDQQVSRNQASGAFRGQQVFKDPFPSGSFRTQQVFGASISSVAFTDQQMSSTLTSEAFTDQQVSRSLTSGAFGDQRLFRDPFPSGSFRTQQVFGPSISLGTFGNQQVSRPLSGTFRNQQFPANTSGAGIIGLVASNDFLRPSSNPPSESFRSEGALPRDLSTFSVILSSEPHYNGTSQQIDACPRDEVKLPDGGCYHLLTQGPCNVTEYVLLNPETNQGYCAPRL
ncbi:putative collagen alpha-1(I) chain-like 3, partial [Homarus americanus]